MSRLLVAIALLIATASIATAQGKLVCGHTGFNINLGLTTKSWRCAPVAVRVGTGTLTFNATTTVTSSPAAFASIFPPEAVPAADNTFFATSALIAEVAGRRWIMRVTAKASDSQISVIIGGAAPSFSGTATKWSYWSTTCYLANLTHTSVTDNVVPNISSTRIWGTDGDVSAATNRSSANATIHILGWQHATGTGFPGSYFTSRPQGHWHGIIENGGSFGLSNTAQAIIMGGPISGPSGIRAMEWQFSVQSHNADYFPTTCFYIASP